MSLDETVQKPAETAYIDSLLDLYSNGKAPSRTKEIFEHRLDQIIGDGSDVLVQFSEIAERLGTGKDDEKIRAYFLNEYITPALMHLNADQTRDYFKTLKKVLSCVEKGKGQKEKMYLFMEIARILPDKLNQAYIDLITKTVDSPNQTNGAIPIIWGVLSDEIKFYNVQEVYGKTDRPGPLFDKANKLVFEIEKKALQYSAK